MILLMKNFNCVFRCGTSVQTGVGFARYAYIVHKCLQQVCTLYLPTEGRHQTALVAVFTEELFLMQ